MVTRTDGMQEMAVIFCKNFSEVVRQVRCGEPLRPASFLGFACGLWQSNGIEARPLLRADSQADIDAAVAAGYTVTAYVRYPDLDAFVPFTSAVEMAAAKAANAQILGKRPYGPLPN